MAIRILIVDDHMIFRQGLQHMLAEEQDIDVVGVAEDGATALDAIGQLHPDVITLDIRLGTIDGIQIMRQVRQHNPNARFIVLTTYEDEQHVRAALQSGAYAYLLKSTSYDTLAGAIRAVHQGQRLLAPELMHHILDEYCRVFQAELQRDLQLSNQDLDVLRHLAGGATSKDIAERLFVSEITVKRKIQDISDKLNATNRVHAVAEAVRRGLI